MVFFLLDNRRILFITQIPDSFPECKGLWQPYGDHETVSVRPQCPYPEKMELKLRKSLVLDGVGKPLLLTADLLLLN